ncbi:MAG: hypothetical protein F6K39_42415 [Okeania sp. SIO3B3]|nr:hypothetical protein [Okeania sp. SIO3B3]
MILIAHYLGVSPQNSGVRREERRRRRKRNRRRKFFGERKGHRVPSHSYPDIISYLKLPTPVFTVDISRKEATDNSSGRQQGEIIDNLWIRIDLIFDFYAYV